MSDTKLRGATRCALCFTRTADMRAVEGVLGEYVCMDEEACLARQTANNAEADPEPQRRVVVTRPVEPDVTSPVWEMVGDGRLSEDWVTSGFEKLIGKRVVCVTQVATAMSNAGPVTLPVGPQGTLVAVFGDALLLRNAGGKAVFVLLEKMVWVEEA